MILYVEDLRDLIKTHPGAIKKKEYCDDGEQIKKLEVDMRNAGAITAIRYVSKYECYKWSRVYTKDISNHGILVDHQKRIVSDLLIAENVLYWGIIE